MRLTHLMISLPLIIGFAQFVPPAVAETMDPSQATTLLAKSHALNLKCNVLGDADGQQLRDFVARAEISLAEKVSVSAARKAIAAGRSNGQSAACDEANRKMVGDVLSAAKSAVETPVATQASTEPVQLEKPETTALAVVEPEAQKPKLASQTIIIKPQKPAAKLKSAATTKPLKPMQTKAGLQGYAKVAETYYAALKCGNLNQGKLAKLYQNVLASHQQALASNRPRDVKAMLRDAEARAGGRSCS